MNSNFDYERHRSELFRKVLPIFVIVATIGIVVWAAFIRSPGETEQPESAWEPRVGLLLAREGVPFDPGFAVATPAEMAGAPVAPRFDFPMGGELGALTYNAQPFLTSRHLGDDLNGIGGGDSDLGDPVYAVADGRVIFSGWPSDGWGNVIIVLHQLPEGNLVETLYGHLQKVNVPVGAIVKRGQKIGTVGKADGRYLAHLHFEIREHTSISAGQGYADSKLGRISGERFLTRRRGAPADLLNGPVSGEDPIAPDKQREGVTIDAR